MGWVDTLSTAVDNVFSTSLTERNGTVVPTTDSVTNSQAVKLDATFLYADLAGSAMLSRVCPWQTTAKIMRAYLDCTTRLIKVWGGEIRSFDGDRVMGLFVGDLKNTHATNCAREIFYTVENILGPKATKKFDSIRNNDIKLKNGIGIDTGEARAVRAGIRNSNDLIWIGRAPSLAAKLSDLRNYPYCVYISEASYKKLPDTSKLVDGKNIWVEKTFTFAGESHKVYGTLHMKTP
jgi:adenylate cyclase